MIKCIIISILILGGINMPVEKYYISKDTEKELKKDINYYIDLYSKTHKIEKALLKAIMKHESQNNTNAIRYERKLKKATWYNKLLSPSEKKNWKSYCSVGLMQILHGIAKSYGFKEDPELLKDPKYGIAYGAMHLKKLISKHYYLENVISVYNYGVVKKRRNGKFYNQKDYVDPVLEYYKKFGGKIK